MLIKSKLPNIMGENTYLFRLIDDRTGKVKQEVESHNLIVDHFWEKQNTSAPRVGWINYTYYQGMTAHGLWLGSGTGTPSSADTALFSPLWVIYPASSRSYKVSDDKLSAEATMTFIFPANSSYVGTVTEAGLTVNDKSGDYGTYNAIMSHCLLTDAEGNAISITKTENDKLEVIVTYRIVIPSESGAFKFLPIDRGNWYKLYTLAGVMQPSCNGILYDASIGLLRNRKPKITYDAYTASPALTTASKTYAVGQVTFATQRMEASVGNTHYYPCLYVSGLGYYQFPNEDIFPTYTIEGVDIGVGDGSITEFKNPFNYFLPESEKVYVNGVLQTRDVDYTIDAENNVDMLSEISAGNYIEAIYSDADASHVSTGYGYVLPFFMPSEGAQYAYADASNTGIYLKLNTPMYIILEEAMKVNTCYLRNIVFNGSTANISVKLEYSTDGETYVELFTSDTFASKDGSKFTFDEVTAKYWRLTLLTQSASTSYDAYHVGGQNVVTSFLGYVGSDQITFTNPPAAGDVITMDVQMDIPFKNENYVIDIAAELTF